MMPHQSNTPEVLKDLARQIAKCSQAADDKTLKAAQLVKEARTRVEQGEAGDVTWYEWARANIGLSPSRLRELDQIARSDNPAETLELLRTQTRNRVARYRKRQQAAPLRNAAADTPKLDPERAELLEWARNASVCQIRSVLRFIRSQDEASNSPPTHTLDEQADASPRPQVH